VEAKWNRNEGVEVQTKDHEVRNVPNLAEAIELDLLLVNFFVNSVMNCQVKSDLPLSVAF